MYRPCKKYVTMIQQNKALTYNITSQTDKDKKCNIQNLSHNKCVNKYTKLKWRLIICNENNNYNETRWKMGHMTVKNSEALSKPVIHRHLTLPLAAISSNKADTKL